MGNTLQRTPLILRFLALLDPIALGVLGLPFV